MFALISFAPYEGEELLGIYDSKKAAESAWEEYKENEDNEVYENTQHLIFEISPNNPARLYFSKARLG